VPQKKRESLLGKFQKGQLERDGLATSAIHGDKTQGARLDALAAFKESKLEILVATDVAARGLDVDDLPLVVNYELPHVPEDYIHRIGRTGRAGATGEAISLVAHEEEKYLSEIERLLKKKIAVRTMDGFDPETTSSRVPHSPQAPARHPRGEAKPAAPERAPARVQRTPPPVSRTPREQEREDAYARNPDQPLPARTAGHAHAKPAHVHGHGAHKGRPVPALLMKRKTTEPA
jgi:ATP-dependent RNA helicase RhlE